MTEFPIRDGDVGIEIPLNLLHNGVDVSPGSVTEARLLVRHSGNQVRALVLDAPGGSTEFPDQWIYTMTQEDFDELGIGQFYAEVHVILNGGLGERTFPTKGGLTLQIIKKLVDPLDGDSGVIDGAEIDDETGQVVVDDESGEVVLTDG